MILRARSLSIPCWISIVCRARPPAAGSIGWYFNERYVPSCKLRLQNFHCRFHFEVIGRHDGNGFSVPKNLRVRILKVVALTDFFARLIDRIIDFLNIDSGNYVERRHTRPSTPSLAGGVEHIRTRRNLKPE